MSRRIISTKREQQTCLILLHYCLLNAGIRWPKHIDELRILLANNHYDVITTNKTTLDESILNFEMYILGYEII